jgi:hypothetical protein
MAFVPALVGGLVGGSILKSIFGKKPVAAPVVTGQREASPRSRSALLDAIGSRRGTLANRRTSAGGVESTTGKKTALGQ